MATDPMVYQFIGETVQNATDAFVAPAAARLMISLQLIAVTGVTLYVTLTGYAVMTGAVESPFWTWVKQCVKISIIAYFALSADGYTNQVVGSLNGLETGLANALNLDSSGNDTSIYKVLDLSLGRGMEIVTTCFEKANEAGWSIGAALGWTIAGLFVALGTVLVSMLGAGVVIVAKFSLALVFALGPLFVLSLMFPITARLFDAWFSQVLNYTFTIVLMAVVMSFAMKSYDTFIVNADFSGSGDDNPIFASIQILALTGVLIWIILQVGGVASGLAGGVSMAAMSIRHLVSPVTGGVGMVTSAGNMAKSAGNMLNPMTTRRDMQSGQMVTARRANHLVAGNTVWNPAYRQHVRENMWKNWSRAHGGNVRKAD